ncbi:MAG TPA: MFS transporter [Caulobacteraceae bacterium]|nr:MFS transporter [Caulobacteraceae bacterium]
MSQSAAAPRRGFVATMLLFSSVGMPLGALGIAMQIYVQPYFAQDLGVGLVALGAAFGIVRLIDLFVDIFLALAMDRTRTPIGRYRNWVLIGAPVLMIAAYELFMARRGIKIDFLIIWLLVMNLAASTLNIARFAWSATLVTQYSKRALFYGVMAAVGVVGNIVVLSMPVISAAFPHHSMAGDVHLMGWTILAMTPITVILATALVPEQINPDAAKLRAPLSDYLDLIKRPELIRLFVMSFGTTLGPVWMGNLYIFFFTIARGFTTGQASALLIFYVLAGALGAPLIGLIAARFSKHRTLIAGAIFYSLGLCTVLIVPKANFLLSVPVMIWCGYWGAGFDLMTSAMMADVGDQVRLEQGKERMGLLYAVISLASKLANAGAVMIAYPLLAFIGFVPTLGINNTPSVINGLQLCFLLGPIFWVALGGACCIGWKLDAKKHAQIRTELDARDAVLLAVATETPFG